MPGLIIKTPPAVEPVTLDQAKEHLRVQHDNENAYISALIKAARKYAEKVTGRTFISTVYLLSLDRFPASAAEPVLLPRPNLVSVDFVKYRDTAGVLQTWAAENYGISTASVPGQLFPAFNKEWPDTRNQPDAVTIEYTAGFGAAATDIPEPLIAAIKLVLGTLYMNREDVVLGVNAQMVPFSAKSLLDLYRIKRFDGGL